MKRLFVFIFAFSISISAFAHVGHYYVSSKYANVYAAPSLDAEVLTVLNKNRSFTVNEIHGKWACVTFRESPAFVLIADLTRYYVINDGDKDDPIVDLEEKKEKIEKSKTIVKDTEIPNTNITPTPGTKKPVDIPDEEESKDTEVTYDFITSSNGSYHVIAETLRVRSQPAISSSIIGFLSQGQVVAVDGVHEDWARIKYQGKDGFVAMKYLDFISKKADDLMQDDSQDCTMTETTVNSPKQPVTVSSHYSETTPTNNKYDYNTLWMGFCLGYNFSNSKGVDDVFHGYTIGIKSIARFDPNFGVYTGAIYGATFAKVMGETYMTNYVNLELGPSMVFNVGEQSAVYLYCAPAGLSILIPDKKIEDTKTEVQYTCGFGAGVSFYNATFNAGYNLLVGNKAPYKHKYVGGIFQVSVAFGLGLR